MVIGASLHLEIMRCSMLASTTGTRPSGVKSIGLPDTALTVRDVTSFKHSQTIQAQNLQNQRRMDGIRKGSTGDFSGESNSTTPQLLSTKYPVQAANSTYSIRIAPSAIFWASWLALAAYTRDGDFFWTVIRTQKCV